MRDVATGNDLPDAIKWSKFSGAAWTKDGSGFFYCRYDAPMSKDEALNAVNKYQKVFFHKVGTAKGDDELVYERPDKPDWGFGADVTDDGRWLFIYQSEGTNRGESDLPARPSGSGRQRSSPSSTRSMRRTTSSATTARLSTS